MRLFLPSYKVQTQRPIIMAHEDHSLERALYRALCFNNNDDQHILQLCRRTKQGPLIECSIHRTTVLHLACFSERFELADKLLNELKDDQICSLTTVRNAWGDTILCDLSTSNKGIEFAKKLLKKVPELLKIRNKLDESCVFQAIRHGQKEMYKFLAKEVDEFCRSQKELGKLHFFQNKYKTTILHMAILTRHFDIALMIAESYEELHHEIDSDQKMTALQMLAHSPAAFKSGAKLGFIREFMYSIVSTDEEDTIGEVGIIGKAIKLISGCIGKRWCICPMIEEIRKMKKCNQNAVELAKILIKTDTSWKKTKKPPAALTPCIKDVVRPQDSEGGPSNNSRKEAPLFMAVRKGCNEIVEEILDAYPQAVEYVNSDGENLLHVAVKSRNLDVVEYVEQKPLLLKAFLVDVDNNYNTILHKVGSEDSEDTKTKSPVVQLSEELQWLERLENLCPRYLKNHQNTGKKTAHEEFAERKEKLRLEAKEFLKSTAEHCTVVIILIATVAFAAAYTVPGGPDERTGLPVLLGQPLFLVFTISDVVSLGFALTAVVIFLSILTSPFRLTDFKRSLPQKLLLGFTFLFLSVSMMMISFAATIILTIYTRQRWTKIALYIASFFPIVMFMLSYVPFYKDLFLVLKHWVTKVGKFLPRPAHSLEDLEIV